MPGAASRDAFDFTPRAAYVPPVHSADDITYCVRCAATRRTAVAALAGPRGRAAGDA
jgi:hypothetical protein